MKVLDFELGLSRGMGFRSLVVLFLSWQSAGCHSTPRCPPRPPLASPATTVALPRALARGGNNNTPINTWSCVNSISINGHSPPALAGTPAAPLAPGGAS